MRKLSKVLSILLAMVLVFSAASIGVEAQYYAYKDVEVAYDAIDQPILSTEQYASMAMDEVDRMLMKENLTVNETFLALEVKGDFSTVDKALDSVDHIYNQFSSALGRLGDVGQLDFDPLLNCPRRNDAGASDLDIFKAIIEFLSVNSGILKKAVDGTLNLGILAGFVNLGDKLNIPKMAKEAIAKIVWPELEKSQYDLTKTIDEYLEILIDRVLNGTYPKDKSKAIARVSEVALDYLPGITDRIDFLGDSVYTIVEQGVRAVLESPTAMSFINSYVRRWLHMFCGYSYTKGKDSAGNTTYTLNPDTSNVKPEYVALVNLNFTLTKFDTSKWGDDTFIDHLNDIVGKVVETAFTSAANIHWDYTRGNEALIPNIRQATEVVLQFTGTDLFASYVEVLPIEQVHAMTDDQFVAYILRSIMNGSIDSVYIGAEATTTVEVLFETVRSLAADVVPSLDYSGLTANLDNMIRMGLDMAAYGLRTGTNLDIPYGASQEQFADALMDWVINQYGGFVSDVSGTGWEALSNVFFNFIPADWLPTKEDGGERDAIDEILFDDIIDNVMNFDIAAVLDLFAKNPTGELNGTVIEVLLARVTNILNYIIPGTFPTDREYTQLEDLLDTTLLGQIVEGLLNGLYDRFDDLAASLLPLMCSILDLSTPEEFGYPYVSLEDITVLDPTLTDTFYVFNGSKGINTAFTDKYGNPTQRDELYKYRINSIEVDNDDLSVLTEAGRSPAGVIINGGQSVNFKIDGLDADTECLLTVVINYDVYGETGAKMTTAPLTATNYVYVSAKDDDNEKVEPMNPVASNLHALYVKNYYLRAGAEVSDLADIERRNASKVASQHTLEATVTIDTVDFSNAQGLAALGVTGNTGFVVNTNKDGGLYDVNPYIASGDSVIPEGKYKVFLKLVASPTDTYPQNFERDQFIWVYDDHGLSDYLRSAVRADRQQSSYGTGNYTANYIPFDSLSAIPEDATAEDLDALKEAVTVNGADAWDAYTDAVKFAAELLYAPRLANDFGDRVESFEDAARSLYTATQELEACSVSSGAAALKAARNALIPDDTFVVEENGSPKLDDEGNVVKDTYPYYDARHTFFGREDYVSFTYSRFKPEWRAANGIINRWEDGLAGKDVEPISAVEAAYATHRFNLYANRLIRIRAYKEHLNAALLRFKDLYNAGKGTWSTESWNDFTTAYTFATNVNMEAIGTTLSDGEHLANDGLRQSKVNTARDQLIRAAKRLVEGKTDFSELNALIAENKPIYDANGEGYTAVSFAAFKTAYEAATAVAANSAATQDEVDAAYMELSDKANKLAREQVEEGELTFIEKDEVQPLLMQSEENGVNFVVGLDEAWIGSLADFIETSGGYYYEINDNNGGNESTGATLTIFDANDDEVGTYTLVLYGEVTGDGEITLYDAITIVSAYNGEEVGWEEYGSTDDFAESFAADVDHNGEIALKDAGELIAHYNGVQTINQQYKEDGDTLFFYDV